MKREVGTSQLKIDANTGPILSAEGDCAVRTQFGEGIDLDVNAKVHAFCRAVEQARIAGVVEWVPAYSVATVYYRPEVIRYAELRDRLAKIGADAGADKHAESSLIEIPVTYGGEWGPDLADVAGAVGLSEADVVSLHSRQVYRCYMMGFLPGFAYLGEVPQEIRVPRLSTPRVRVPAGSVAVAQAQTGIYPQESPGGWNLIGRTPLTVFDNDSDPPALISAGDYVRFVPITPAEYAGVTDAVASGEYKLNRTSYEG